MADIPDVQKAWLVVRQGDPVKALELRSDWPVPKKLSPGEVLLKIHAGALNPVGWKLMKVIPNVFAKIPRVAEHDFAGEVVDANGTEYSNGDQVFGFIPADLNQSTRQGALAQYMRIHTDFITKRPLNISPVEASGITLAAETAYQALYNKGKIEEGQTVFINGGSTAVGSFAIQIAKAAGAKVITTASAKNEHYVRNLGADEFIDYTQVDLPKFLAENAPSPKYHIIFDAVGLPSPALYTKSESYLAPNGTFVTVGPSDFSSWFAILDILKTIGAILTPRILGGTKRKYSFFFINHQKSDLVVLRDLLANDSLKPLVDSVYEFEDALNAYNRIKSNRATGKVVVKVDPTVT